MIVDGIVGRDMFIRRDVAPIGGDVIIPVCGGRATGEAEGDDVARSDDVASGEGVDIPSIEITGARWGDPGVGVPCTNPNPCPGAGSWERITLPGAVTETSPFPTLSSTSGGSCGCGGGDGDLCGCFIALRSGFFSAPNEGGVKFAGNVARLSNPVREETGPCDVFVEVLGRGGG